MRDETLHYEIEHLKISGIEMKKQIRQLKGIAIAAIALLVTMICTGAAGAKKDGVFKALTVEKLTVVGPDEKRQVFIGSMGFKDPASGKASQKATIVVFGEDGSVAFQAPK